MKKLLSVFFMLCGAAWALAGCQKNQPLIVFSAQNEISSYNQHVLENVTASLKDRSIDTALTQSDGTEAQLEAFEGLIAQHPTAAVVFLSDKAEATAFLNAADNTPVLFVGAEPSDEVLAKYNNAWYVGFSPALCGELAGSQAAMLYGSGAITDLNSDLLLSYFSVFTDRDTETGDQRLSGVLRSLENAGVFTTPLGAARGDAFPDYPAGVELLICTDNAAMEAVLAAFAEDGSWEGMDMPPIVLVGTDASQLTPVAEGLVAGGASCNASDSGTALCAMLENIIAGRYVTYETTYLLAEAGKVYLSPHPITTVS